MKLYSSLSKKNHTVAGPLVKIYACGPTVYKYAHIGNLRTYIHEDILIRTLLYHNFTVKHIINITDVGHLISDQDSGEDKMELSAQEEGVTIDQIAQKYTEAFLKDFTALNNLPPTRWVKASEHIDEQIAMISELEKLGYTYKIDDGIYYDTSKFKDYALFSGQEIDSLKTNTRAVVNQQKRNSSDFALWKFSPQGKKRMMEWDSPWGKGFPGWHIECSAMAFQYLGDHLDIHCGGIEHIKIHHANEVAQITPLIKKNWVDIWFHTEFLTSDKNKMSKSMGNFLTLQQLQEKNYHPLVYRYYVLLSHYRSKLAFSWQSLDAAKKAYLHLRELTSKYTDGPFDQEQFKSIQEKIEAIIDNDLNTPQLIAYLWTVVKDETISSSLKFNLLPIFNKILALDLGEKWTENIPADIYDLVRKRELARQQKNFALADQLRQQIDNLGFELLDSKDGPTIKRK